MHFLQQISKKIISAVEKSARMRYINILKKTL